MEELHCEKCGAILKVDDKSNDIFVCPYCGTTNILDRKETSQTVKQLRIGDFELSNCSWDRAITAYKKAIETDSNEPKGYFGLALAEYRVHYVEDYRNDNVYYQPIVYSIPKTKFSDNPNYLKALQLASPEQKEELENRAKEIDYIGIQFQKYEKDGINFDCFLCLKVTGENNQPTKEVGDAYKLYDYLLKKGFHPFFSEKVMEDNIGADYEALILYALYKSTSMIIICYNEEYLLTPWVRNEYSRYLSLMDKKVHDKGSITILFDKSPIDFLPGFDGAIQGINKNNLTAYDDICNFINAYKDQNAVFKKININDLNFGSYQVAISEFNKATDPNEYKNILEKFVALGKFKESEKYAKLCEEKINSYNTKLLAEAKKILAKNNLSSDTYKEISNRVVRDWIGHTPNEVSLLSKELLLMYEKTREKEIKLSNDRRKKQDAIEREKQKQAQKASVKAKKAEEKKTERFNRSFKRRQKIDKIKNSIVSFFKSSIFGFTASGIFYACVLTCFVLTGFVLPNSVSGEYLIIAPIASTVLTILYLILVKFVPINGYKYDNVARVIPTLMTIIGYILEGFTLTLFTLNLHNTSIYMLIAITILAISPSLLLYFSIRAFGETIQSWISYIFLIVLCGFVVVLSKDNFNLDSTSSIVKTSCLTVTSFILAFGLAYKAFAVYEFKVLRILTRIGVILMAILCTNVNNIISTITLIPTALLILRSISARKSYYDMMW